MPSQYAELAFYIIGRPEAPEARATKSRVPRIPTTVADSQESAGVSYEPPALFESLQSQDWVTNWQRKEIFPCR